MAMYRILHVLHVGKGRMLHPGSFDRLEWLKPGGVERLTIKGAISRVKPPPLAVLPGWATRARKLTEVTGGRIVDAEQFLEGETTKIAELMKVKPETVERWRKDIVKWLTTAPVRAG